MKRKITAVLLCIALLLTLSINTSAVELNHELTTNEAQTISLNNEVTVNVDENAPIDVIEPIQPIDSGVSLTATGATPTGFLDKVTSTQIGGWAYQSDIPNTALQVHIYIINNSTGEQKIIGTTANGYRADLEAAGYGNGYHAFRYAINWKTYKPGTYTVRAYAIGVNASNPQLANSPKTFTVRSATGGVEYVNSNGIGGWAWKPDAPDLTIDVHAYIYKLDGTQVAVYSTNAYHPRPDLLEAGYGDGDHGFSISVNWSSLPKEELKVVVYAVDGSGYNPSFYKGYYNNADPHGAISLYGIEFEGEDPNTAYYTNDVVQAIANIGVTAINGIYIGSTPSDALNKMRNSMIWVIHSHGSQKSVTFNHSVAGRDYMRYSDISALPDGALSGERCVIYGTCSAGAGGEGAENMVNITHQKGAMTVIGWTGTIGHHRADTWLEAFFKSCGEGKRIGDGDTDNTAIKDAFHAVAKKHGDELGTLANIYCVGSTTQKLTS